MEEKKRVRTDASRKADKKYREKHKPIQLSVQYKNDDKVEGKRVKAYLESIGQSANSYIKSLIKTDLDNKGIEYPVSEENDVE